MYGFLKNHTIVEILIFGCDILDCFGLNTQISSQFELEFGLVCILEIEFVHEETKPNQTKPRFGFLSLESEQTITGSLSMTHNRKIIFKFRVAGRGGPVESRGLNQTVSYLGQGHKICP